ncbi:hypothetical protein DEFR109230_11810 [Deinococcus frigens]|uniref:hypothetical protein n=1 Tax=Deinococcus frigens TaxID=249403 RepID=UPI00138E266F|nr:hypothetical protein [Deinococcus frigens]
MSRQTPPPTPVHPYRCAALYAGTEPVPTVTAAQMTEVDRAMVQDYGISLLQMMENAGRALAGRWPGRHVASWAARSRASASRCCAGLATMAVVVWSRPAACRIGARR